MTRSKGVNDNAQTLLLIFIARTSLSLMDLLLQQQAGPMPIIWPVPLPGHGMDVALFTGHSLRFAYRKPYEKFQADFLSDWGLGVPSSPGAG
jgi:hypothetical protein